MPRQNASVAAIKALGLEGQVQDGPGSVRHGRYTRDYLANVSATIAGGTSEIQRNVIATRGCGCRGGRAGPAESGRPRPEMQTVAWGMYDRVLR